MVDGVIVLYEQNETNFTSNGLGYLSDVIECTVSEELNGEYELEMEYPVDGIRYSEIQHRRILYVKPNPYEGPQPFRIYNINRPIDGRVEINARHISYDLSGYTVSESEDKHIPFSTSPKMFCEKIPSAMTELNSGMPPFTFWTNSVEEYNSETYAEEGDELKEKHWIYIDTPSSVRSLIGQFTEKYKGEFKFDKYAVKFYGPVSGQSEDDKHYRGTDSGVVLRYGKNLTDLMQEEDSDKGMYTHLYPYWSGTVNTTNTDSESDESSGSTTYSSRSEEKVVTMTNKLYPIFDHDVGYKRVLIYEVNSDWNEKHPNNTNDATPWPSEEDFEELCKEYIKNNELGAPKIALTASFVQLSRSAEYEDLKPLEKVLLGDTVSVFWEELGVDSTLKCTKTEYDALTDSYKSITLGNDANASISSTVAATSSGLSGVTSSMSDKVSKEEFYNQTYDTALSTTSTNAVQNKVVTSKFNEMKRCCDEVNGEIEYLKEFVSRAGGTLSYGTDIPTGGEDGDGYVQVAQSGGTTPITLSVGNNTGNWPVNDFTVSNKKYSFNITGIGNPRLDIANINAVNLTPDHEYRVNFTAKMSSNASYYNHGAFTFGVNVAEFNSLIMIDHNNIARGTYYSPERYQSFYEDNTTHNYSFVFRTDANENKVSLSFSFHDVRDNNQVTLDVTNFTVVDTGSGDNEIIDLWFKIDGKWLVYPNDQEDEPVFTYGSSDPDGTTEGNIYAKVNDGAIDSISYKVDGSWLLGPSGGGGSGGVTRETIWTGRAYSGSGSSTTNKPITDYDLLLCYHYDYPGVTTDEEAHLFWLDPKRIADNNYAVNYYDGNFEYSYYDSSYLRGKFTNATTFIICSESSGGVLFRIDGIKFSGSGGGSGGGGATRETIYTGTQRENTITLSKSIANYDYLILQAVATISGNNYYNSNILSVSEIISSGTNKVGVSDDIAYLWYDLTSNTSLSFDGASGNYYIKSIEGLKFGSGGSGGGGSEKTDLLYSAPDATVPNTITLAHPYTDYEKLVVTVQTPAAAGNVGVASNTFYVDDFDTIEIIGGCSDIAYIWYTLTDAITLTMAAGARGYYIKSIYGLKSSGGSGSASCYNLIDPPITNGDSGMFGTATATSSLNSNFGPGTAFNGIQADPSNGRNGWLSAESDQSPTLTLAFNAGAKILNFVKLEILNNGSAYCWDPVYIEGSNNGSAWTNILKTRQSVVFDLAANGYSYYNIELNGNKYSHFRIRGAEPFYKTTSGYPACIFSNVLIYGSDDLDNG